MRSIITFTLLCIAALSSPQLLADRAKRTPRIWEPPVLYPENFPKPSVPKPMITSVNLAKTRIILEETRLDDVRRLVGGTLGHKGDAGGSLSWLCYSGNDGAGRWVLWLESSEIAGGTVNGFAMQRVETNLAVDSRCESLSNEADLPLGLKLDLPEIAVLKILGRPTLRHRNTLVYYHEHNEMIRGEPYSAGNSVSVFFQHGSAAIIEVWKTTSS